MKPRLDPLVSSPNPFGGSLYGNLVFALGILDFLRVRGFLFRNFRLEILEFPKIPLKFV